MFLFLSSVLVMSVFWEAECNQASSNTSFFPVVHGSLWSLDFSNRNLSSRDISCGTFKHSQLKYLNLSNNHLVMFPLCLPATLNVLDLSNNNISELTDHSFQDLLDLHTLILHHNNIIQVLLNTTLNLKVLDLSYNQLLSLPVTTNWSNLTYLSIAENQIENVYLNDLNTFQSLEHLNLSGNPLAYFNTSGMADASAGNLIELDIRNTNITNDTRCSYFQKFETLHMVRNQHLSHQEHSLKECMPTLSKVNFKNTNSLDTGNSKIFNILQELKFFSIKKYEASTSASIQNALDNTGTIRTDGTTISAVKETAKSAASETTTGMTTETTLVTTVTYTHMGQEKTTSIRTNGTPNSPNSESTKAAASETTKTAATEIKIAASATPKATLESPKHSPLSNLTTPFQQFDFGTDEYESDDLPSKHDQFNPQLVTCDYDPCRDLQIPCLDLQKLHKCLCPGMSTAAIRPNPPMLKEASEITYTSANIHWCAPYSAVSEYQLKVEREDGLVHLNDHIHETFRRFTVYGLPAGTTHSVCVAAKNKAGTSDEVCTTFKTEHDYTIFMYAFATATGLLLLVAIVLAVCLYKRSKNPPPELPYLTNSISIQNPAFSHPMGKYDFSNNI
ncbi:leucine-rich repeat neuronal protein 4-like isoform X2 [Polyodon spathula]|uniref:leucine-rich repeat neuronal protein 4-like isoform X2 n=1 Tax=Polyodon spathula TaxID=7913 RepID=UPI001B7E860E|nr:leucine-rich repeat neuronal protein 4-like isoform X2 [Polyodon spathula]